MKATKLLKLSIKLRKKSKLLSHFIVLILRYVFSFEAYISEKTIIGDNVQFKHNGLGVVLHHAKDNCWIHQNVTIGSNIKYSEGILSNSGAPIIEENTIVYAGAVIVGPITIGSNCVIGANSVVTRDVPSNSLVYGNPAIVKKIKNDISYSSKRNSN